MADGTKTKGFQEHIVRKFSKYINVMNKNIFKFSVKSGKHSTRTLSLVQNNRVVTESSFLFS